MANTSNPLERVLSSRLRACSAAEKLSLASETLSAMGDRFEPEVVKTLASELQGLEPSLLQPWAETLPQTANASYLRADLASESADAVAQWRQFFTVCARRDPFDLLAYSRVLADLGEFDQAAAQLRLALLQRVPYQFFSRSEKLIAKVAARSEDSLRQCKIALLGSSTTALMAPLLKALCLRDRIKVKIYEGLYGSIDQEALDPSSGLASFKPDLVFVVNHWRDLQLSALTEDEAGAVARTVENKVALWRRLSAQSGCHVVQHGFDYPAEEPYGYLAESLPGGRTRLIDLLNLRMREALPPHVSILNLAAVQRETGAWRWEDAMAWNSFKQHPSTDALPALAEVQMAHVRAVLGLTRKVLVTDLDNTLWKGVIGEDGLNGIQAGPGTPAGEAHRRLQEYLLDLKRRGILLAVCSKNNPEDARRPFEQHEHMALKLDDFASFKANWDDKVTNLKAIAQELSLGLDSFVFLDDNPLEREWVRSQLPQVAVVELGSSVFHYVRDLDRGRYFYSLSLSSEDLQRAEQYRMEAQRENIRSSAGSLDEFLAQLQLQASMEPVTAANLPRVTQLINKTNQFNVTTRRYTEAQVQAMAADPAGWAGAFQMSDRMGSYGLIGTILCKPGSAAQEWEIDTWLMSCRTLGRQMEKFMFDRLIDAALAKGIVKLTGVFRPTAKNVLVKELFDQLGFTAISESPEEKRYELAVPGEPIRTATHVAIR